MTDLALVPTTDPQPGGDTPCRAPVATPSVGRSLRQAADRLMAEHADDVAPGQVLATVARIDRALRGLPGLDPDARAVACESAVRVALALRTRDTGEGP